jgi:hypothetical protein
MGGGGMITEFPIPFPHLVTGSDKALGAEVAIFHSDRAIPDHLGNEDGCFSLKLHQDGSHCPDSCACEGREVMHAAIGETLVMGEWTWRTSRTCIVGWRRIGPSDAEQALEVRAATAEKALHDEEVLHRSTINDLRNTRDALATVIGEREEAQRELRLSKGAHLRADEDAITWKHRAVGAGVAAVVLVLLLVWAVIA